MKYFITGGAGFIGSQLALKIFQKEPNSSITIFDNFSSGKKEFIREFEKKTNFKAIESDLFDLDLLKKSVRGHDFVFHLAANPDIRKGIEITDLDLKQNTIVTYNVLEAMRLNNVKKIGFSSSSVIYGEPKVFPTPEDYGPLLPISLYGASKLACEALISSFSHIYGLQSWIFRFANVTGSRPTHGVIYDFIKKLEKNPKELAVLGDGKQKKSYLHVDDVIDAMLFLINNTNEQINVYNISSGDQITVAELAKIVIDTMGLKNSKIKFTGTKRGWKGDVVEMNLSIEKINKLGWKAKYNSEGAIRKSMEKITDEKTGRI